MENSKIISVLEHFYKVADSVNPTPEEKESIRYYEFQFAQAIIEDFRGDATTIAKLILDYYSSNSL